MIGILQGAELAFLPYHRYNMQLIGASQTYSLSLARGSHSGGPTQAAPGNESPELAGWQAVLDTWRQGGH